MRADHLEQIAADERLFGALDELGVFALRVVAAARLDGGLRTPDMAKPGEQALLCSEVGDAIAASVAQAEVAVAV